MWTAKRSAIGRPPGLSHRLAPGIGPAISNGALLDRVLPSSHAIRLEKARSSRGKTGRTLVVLFDRRRHGRNAAKRNRYDQEIVDYLRSEKFTYFDMTKFSSAISRTTTCLRGYLKRYFVGHFGHYNPRGIIYSPTRSRTRWSHGSTERLPTETGSAIGRFQGILRIPDS